MILYSIPLIPIDTPSLFSGRIFSIDVANSIISQTVHGHDGYFVNDDMITTPSINHLAFFVNKVVMNKNQTKLLGDIEVLNTSQGILLEQIWNATKGVRFAPAGRGKVTQKNIQLFIEDFKLLRYEAYLIPHNVAAEDPIAAYDRAMKGVC